MRVGKGSICPLEAYAWTKRNMYARAFKGYSRKFIVHAYAYGSCTCMWSSDSVLGGETLLKCIWIRASVAPGMIMLFLVSVSGAPGVVSVD
jgi:hypothetical protein